MDQNEKIEVPREQLESLLKQNTELKQGLSGAINLLAMLKQKLLNGEDMPDFQKMSVVKKGQFAIKLFSRITALNDDSDTNFLDDLSKHFNEFSKLSKHVTETELKKLQ